MIDDLKNYFTFFIFQQFPGAKNKAVDAMATLASILQLEEHELRYEFLVEEMCYPAYDSPDNRVICTITGHDSSHCANIYYYLYYQIIPDDLTRNRNANLSATLPVIPSSLVTCIGGV